jgi:hypothetical protein
MRVIVGAIAVLGIAVTVAVAQPPRERAAVLKPPEPLPPGALPPVARGAIDDVSTAQYLQSTPVARSKMSAPGVASGPPWSSGTDPFVRSASDLGARTGGVQPLTPPPGMDPPPMPPRFIDRIRMPGGAEKAPVAKQSAPPAPVQPTEQPTANTPFRGTGTNGAPVYAGPPAYRWYGWGTVTPGANPLAPAGQYPKASANWYAITGATPGAFPVPVTAAARTAPGTDPPTYGLTRTQPVSPPVTEVAVQPQPAVPFTERPQPSKFGPGDIGAPVPAPVSTPPAPVSVPPLPPLPTPKPTAIAIPELPAVPPIVPPVPAPVTGNEPPVAAPAAIPRPDPLPPLPPIPVVTPAPAVDPVPTPVPVSEAKPPAVEPKPLPTAVTADPPREEQRWQPSDPATPYPGAWKPAPGTAPLPTVPVGSVPGQRNGSTLPLPVVVRGQMGDTKPDPVTTLIKQVCQGRADGVEVRWTGTKKLSVCFEIRTAAEAQKLVNDISRRSELTAYQIDFCVLVK